MAGAKLLETVRAYETGNDVRQVIACSEGGRALRLLKRREENKERTEAEKANIENETKKRKFASIDQKFGGSSADTLEEEFKRQTIGLMSAQEFQAKRQAIDELIQGAQKKGDTHLRLQRRVNGNKLSFKDPDAESDGDDEEQEKASGSEAEAEEEKDVGKRKRLGKCPTVNTSFLYDADREAELEAKKKALAEEYKTEQEQVKKDKLEVTYSYWDGSGHRRSSMVEKGWKIGEFLAKCKAELEKADFPELRTVSLDSLMYVKEDLIIPHKTSLYELIKCRARGKSGPLFNFDVHEDIRINSDVRVEKDESHAGKIVDRKWYERNKHIFPASRWEVWTKDLTFDNYTVHGHEVLPQERSTLRG
jgi:protein FAM50